MDSLKSEIRTFQQKKLSYDESLTTELNQSNGIRFIQVQSTKNIVQTMSESNSPMRAGFTGISEIQFEKQIIEEDEEEEERKTRQNRSYQNLKANIFLKDKFIKLYSKIRVGKMMENEKIYMNQKSYSPEANQMLSEVQTQYKKVIENNQSKDLVLKLVGVVKNEMTQQRNLKSGLLIGTYKSKKEGERTKSSGSRRHKLNIHTLQTTGDSIEDELVSEEDSVFKIFKIQTNIDVESYFKLPQEQKVLFKVRPNLLSFLKPKSSLINEIEYIDIKTYQTSTQENEQTETLMKGFWVVKEVQGFQPVSRDGALLYFDKKDEKLMIIGGSSNVGVFDIYHTVVKKGCKWTRIVPQMNLFSYFGACIEIFQHPVKNQKYVLIFGGIMLIDRASGFSKNKICTSSIKLLNLETLEFESNNVKNEEVEGRKHAAGSILGNTFYMQGGLTTYGECLKDMFQYDIITNQWQELYIKAQNQSFNQKEFHLFRSNHSMNSFQVGKVISHVIFGGMDKRNNPTNELFQLKQLVGTNNITLKQIKDSKGKAPLARSHHSSLLIGTNKYLLIYGGKNESLYALNQNIGLNDFVLFNFKLNQWESIEMIGFIPTGRWNACIEYDSVQNRIFLFGGSNFQGYCSNDLYSFEMNANKIESLTERLQNAQAQITILENKVQEQYNMQTRRLSSNFMKMTTIKSQVQTPTVPKSFLKNISDEVPSIDI